MKNAVKILVVIGAFVAAYVILRRNPAAIQVIQNAAGIAPVSPVNYAVNVSGYTPHDYPLPNIPGTSININRYSTCNFCLNRRPNIEPAGDVAPMLPSNEYLTVTFDNSSFGGAG